MAEPTAPRIVHPRDGATVDGLACRFRWKSAPGVSHRLQVSATDRFDAVVVDVEIGSATELTLYELLPRDGRRLHWRVGTAGSQGSDAWSETTWFLAADYDDRASSAAPAGSRRATSTPATATAPVPDAPTSDQAALFQNATTSLAEMLGAFAVLVLVILLILFVVL